jgi:predicted  nucleic acid-binding Zn-ribbon protein
MEKMWNELEPMTFDEKKERLKKAVKKREQLEALGISLIMIQERLDDLTDVLGEASKKIHKGWYGDAAKLIDDAYDKALSITIGEFISGVE